MKQSDRHLRIVSILEHASHTDIISARCAIYLDASYHHQYYTVTYELVSWREAFREAHI